MIALTFDDGPSPKHLHSVLDLLAKENVVGTFFLVGKDVETHPDLTQLIAAKGHEIGNHAFTHQRMVLMPLDEIAQEIEATDAAIRATGYIGPLHFRPPFGKKLVNLPRYLAQQNRTTIMWDIAPEDWGENDDDLATRIAATARPGSIVLLHVMFNSGERSRTVLPLAIKKLRARGFQFVTISDLLDRQVSRN